MEATAPWIAAEKTVAAMDKTRYCSQRELPLTLRVTEVASVLGIGRNSAYNLINSGELKSVRIGRQIRVSKEELLRFLTR